ncbi:endoribonuclease Dicer isoform X3 [Pieris napi]|uniref:endoribonuclease Dicer isoform X3 n=1 Tax=Pieris napi TaxID=78633 RepID=UPI001FB9A303|nr:endoribonuclease Dicer isoform X3 [Pieris napi]
MDSRSKILQPRLYQVQLEEICITKNTIIYLPTGSGKTFIAARLIKRFMNQLKKPWGEGGKRTFFLVNTVPLVNQQKHVIEEMCPVTVGAYSGEDKVDYWNKIKWDSELSQYQVIIMTSQILHDMLTHKYIMLEDINLLIFDECHHAVDEHPMRLIMRHFDGLCGEQPRVIGLTATLLNCNVTLHKVEDTLRELETTFRATIATVHENVQEIFNHSTNPQEILKCYCPSSPTSAKTEAKKLLLKLMNLIHNYKLPVVKKNVQLQHGQRDISSNPNKIQRELANMVTSMSLHIDEMGAYGGALCIIAYTILLERLKRRALSGEEELLYQFTITGCTEAKLVLLEGMDDEKGYAKIIKHSSPKIKVLLNILKEYKVTENDKPLSAIIFTQQRFTSKILYNLLKAVKKSNPEDFGFLKHDFIVGFNVNPFNNTREQHYAKKLSNQALLKFKNRDLNCLISTRVIEEGVDVPQCSLVVRFDLPLDYRSYIQSKARTNVGCNETHTSLSTLNDARSTCEADPFNDSLHVFKRRARNRESKYIMMVNETEIEKFQSKYYGFQTLESCLQQLIMGNAKDRASPTEEEVQAAYEDDDIPPFVTANGNRLFATSAISLLHRYCNSLPTDQFTLLTPMWILEYVELNPVITIVMPIACSIKEPIKGDPYNSVKTAKRSAALKACVKLYLAKEFDQHLLPKTYGEIKFEQEDIKQCFLNWPWDDPKEDNKDGTPLAGTKKRVRKHKKVYPSYFNALPSVGNQKFYLHLIKLDVAFEKPTESREIALYDLLKMDEGFGFLTMRPLPEICDFPMYLRVGQVMTNIQMNYACVTLDTAQLQLVKRFHFFIFDQLLAVAKKFVIFEGSVNCLYVVPTIKKDGFDINWNVMRTHNEIEPNEIPSDKQRASTKASRETHQRKVVTPWYKPYLIPDRYVVTNVLEYMTPQSQFVTNSFETYADYYTNKHQLQLLGPQDQPLLEVVRINTKMNCLLPRGTTIRSLSEKQMKLIAQAQDDEKPKAFKEIFVPELCTKYEFPSVLWYKAYMLPSIIHRITMLLVAYELRAEISKGISYGKPHPQKGEKWLPIETNINIAKKSLLSQIEEPAAASINSIDRISDPVVSISMKESLYQLQKKKMSAEYAWEENAEPIDIERNITEVTLLDIECYDTFAMAPVSDEKNKAIAMPKNPPIGTAIMPPPPNYSDKINLLSRKATGNGPELRDVLAALTTINSHDSFDLERVETLGDAFLKFAATLYLFHKFPKLNEGQLTNIKGRLIGNRNLFYAGNRIGLGGRIKVEQFSPRMDFVVPGFAAPQEVINFIEERKIRPSILIGMEFPTSEALSGKLSDRSMNLIQNRFIEATSQLRPAEPEPEGGVQNEMQRYIGAQAVSDKSVADCVEALIGTYLLSGGVEAAGLLLEWLRIIPIQDNFLTYFSKDVDTVIKEGKVAENDINRLLNYTKADIESIIQYKFKDPSLLLEALSHPSYIRNRYTRSYERLEFLGDAILDFLITAHIFENCGNLKPGELTDLRSALVNNVTFAAYVVKLGLHKFLCYELNPPLETAIINFAEHQKQRNHDISEDVLYLIDEEECRIAEYIEVPKVLSDIFESLIGAIYLDSHGDLATVWRVVYRIMWKEIAAFSQCVPKQPVRVLLEMMYACASFGEAKATPDNSIPKVMIPVSYTRDGHRHINYGVGSNKAQAKRAAAKLALKVLST